MREREKCYFQQAFTFLEEGNVGSPGIEDVWNAKYLKNWQKGNQNHLLVRVLVALNSSKLTSYFYSILSSR